MFMSTVESNPVPHPAPYEAGADMQYCDNGFIGGPLHAILNLICIPSCAESTNLQVY